MNRFTEIDTDRSKSTFQSRHNAEVRPCHEMESSSNQQLARFIHKVHGTPSMQTLAHGPINRLVLAANLFSKAPPLSITNAPLAIDHARSDALEPTPFREGTCLRKVTGDGSFFTVEKGFVLKPSPQKPSNSAPKSSVNPKGDLQKHLVSFKFPIDDDFSMGKVSVHLDAKPRPEPPENKSLKIKPHHEIKWNEQFKSLLQFKEKYGHCRIPFAYKDNPTLACWAKRQRYLYKLKLKGNSSIISNKRQQMLEDVGFEWDTRVATWEEHFNELVEYKKQKGDCNVPCRYAANPQLGMWVKRQRRQYKLFRIGKVQQLPKHRVAELNRIGFIWDIKVDNSCNKVDAQG